MVHSAEQPTNVPLIRRSALLAQGFSEKEIVGMRRRGGLDRLAAGCYLPPTDLMPEEIHRLRVRAVAGRSPGLVVSHQSAARLHGLPLFSVPTGRVHLIRPGRGGSHLRLGRQVHAAELPDLDIVELDGMLVTSCARTLFDLGRTLSFESAVVAIDFALHHELVSPGQLMAHIGRVGSGPGIGATRRALRFADGRSESVGESRTRVFFRTFSLPIPVPQLEIFDEVGTLLGRADLGITEYGTLIEFDGLAKYDELLAPGQTARDALVKEKVREDGFRECGWIVVRLTHRDLADARAQRGTADRMLRAMRLGRTVAQRGQLAGSSRARRYLGLPPA